MHACSLGILIVSAALGQPDRGQYYPAVMAASRELSSQLHYFEQAVISVPRPRVPPDEHELFPSIEDVLSNLQVLRKKVASQVTPEELKIMLTPIDRKIDRLFMDIQGMERWNPALAMTARRVRYAQLDLQFAINAEGKKAATGPQGQYRQTLALRDRTEDCLAVVRYVFAEQPALPGWNALFADFRAAINKLQKLETDAAAADALKAQVVRADAAWAKIVERFNDTPTAQSLLLRSSIAQVDRMLDRLSRQYGVPDRRPPLKDPFEP